MEGAIACNGLIVVRHHRTRMPLPWVVVAHDAGEWGAMKQFAGQFRRGFFFTLVSLSDAPADGHRRAALTLANNARSTSIISRPQPIAIIIIDLFNASTTETLPLCNYSQRPNSKEKPPAPNVCLPETNKIPPRISTPILSNHMTIIEQTIP